ncbi:MAG: alpha-glucosidase [Maribacter sp.]|jgi:alpha-glucosidase
MNPFSDKKEGPVEKEFSPKNIISNRRVGDDFIFETENNVLLKIQCISDEIIRFRYGTHGYFEADFSYAIDTDFNSKLNECLFIEKKKTFEIITQDLKIIIAKVNAQIIIKNKKGEIICQDEKGFYWENNEEFGGDIVKMSKVSHAEESYYGLGDKPTDLKLNNKYLENWGTDTYGYKENADPIYRNIPFYYSLNEGNSYGIFFDNSFKTHFDFGKERRTVTSFWADGGEMNYYFIYGNELLDVCQKYTLLTGTPEMPPLWSLGYQQCKWSYFPESQVREICDKIREYKIPCDAIYLDIDYMDGFRCFTWDKEKFPQPKKMISELKEQGFKTVVIIDPGIKIDKDYKIFQEGIEKGYFCRRQDGSYAMGKVWPGNCYFPDFTQPEVREWWAGLYQELIAETGIKGVWNDMNEPAIFEVESKTFPLDVRHDYDGNPCSHRKAHNVYGMQMARATYEGVKRFIEPERPLIITRSGYAGLQRYASVWTGDNIASWRHLWLANVQCQRLAISGVSFVGSDVGGFVEHPTPELFYRWVQLAVFHPFFRTHSSGDHGDQEPWSFGGEALTLVREAIELRYRLLPYIYTAFYQYHDEGMPMLRPLTFLEPENEELTDSTDEFMLGDHIFICPILEPKSEGRHLYLPKGNWYHYHTNKKEKGGKEIYSKVNKNYIPTYIKAGSIIPHFPLMQYVGEKKIDIVELKIYYKKGEQKSIFYHDAGNDQEYKKGHFRLVEFTLIGNENELIIQQKIEGYYLSEFNHYSLTIIGLPFKLNEIKIDNKIQKINLNLLRINSGFNVTKIS